MGVTFSLIIGESDTVASLDPFHMPDSDAIITKVLDAVTFAQLHAIVMRCAYDDVIDVYLENPVYSDPDDAYLWVFEVPSVFVTRLAQLPDDGLAQAALAWKNTDELSVPELTLAWVHQLMIDIRMLCNRALLQNRLVFLVTML